MSAVNTGERAQNACGRIAPSFRLVIVSVAAIVWGVRAEAQNAALFERGRQHWEATRYVEAFPDLRAYRLEYQGRNALVDYMIGTSACRMDTQKQFGFRALDWLLYSYPLSEQGRSLVRKERDLCLGVMLQTAETLQLAQMVAAGVTGRGKTFHWADQNTIGAYPVRKTRELTRAEIAVRVAAPGDAEGIARVVRGASQRLGATRVVADGRFVIAAEGVHEAKDLELLAELLERFTEFHARTYGIARPPAVVTIYLTSSIAKLRELAERAHGLDVSPSTIGYSFADDLSVVAVTPRKLYGTVLHELTHLLIRGNFGDAPQWLDEGLASLYEVASEHDGIWLGEGNWRANVLREFRSRWPSVDEVIRSPWFSFDDPEHALGDLQNPPAVEQAVITAYTRYFLLFLQEQGRLVPVFDAVRRRGLGDPDVEAGSEVMNAPGVAQEHTVKLVEGALGARLAMLDHQLRNWLESGVLSEDGPVRTEATTRSIVAGLRVRQEQRE